MVVKLVKTDNGKVRASDDELHRAVSKAIWEGNHIVFESLPMMIGQIIEYQTWKTYQHASFADYALCATTNGLGINTNYRLWMLRCAMDVHGKHVGLWAEIVGKIDDMVRVQATSEGRTIRSHDGNSLQTLAKSVDIGSHGKITYLPSRQRGPGAIDGHLVRLRRNDPEAFGRLVRGEISLQDTRPAASVRKQGAVPLERLKSAYRALPPAAQQAFAQWLQKQVAPQ